jgi:hypothetical protein
LPIFLLNVDFSSHVAWCVSCPEGRIEEEKPPEPFVLSKLIVIFSLKNRQKSAFHYKNLKLCQNVDDYVVYRSPYLSDDVYVNVHNLATVLHSLTVTDQSVYGRQCGGNVPERRGSALFFVLLRIVAQLCATKLNSIICVGKWMTSYENWPWQKFPIYFHGAGVVIAGTAVRPILAAMQVTPYFIWDDM